MRMEVKRPTNRNSIKGTRKDGRGPGYILGLLFISKTKSQARFAQVLLHLFSTQAYLTLAFYPKFQTWIINSHTYTIRFTLSSAQYPCYSWMIGGSL